jgi:hypothetical protein
VLELIDKINYLNGLNKKSAIWRFLMMAEWTGLEPATPGVTGRYSDQLNYHSEYWWVL